MEEAGLLAFLQKVRKPVGSARGGISPSTSVQKRYRWPIGQINFSVIPICENGELIVDGSTMEEGFTVYIHNYTGFWRKPVDRVVQEGRNPVPVKVWRVFDDFSNDWIEQEYVVAVITKNYFGAVLVKVRPDRPVMNIELKVKVSRKSKSSSETKMISSPIQLFKQNPLLTFTSNIIEEVMIRTKTYLAMLEGERRCGLISEEAYYRLKEKLQSMLSDLEKDMEKPVPSIKQKITAKPIL